MSQSLGRFWSLKLCVKIIWSTGAISSLQSLRIYTGISSGPGALLDGNFSKIREIPKVEKYNSSISGKGLDSRVGT